MAPTISTADVMFAAVLVGGLGMVMSLLVVAHPLGRHLLPSGGFHFFGGVQLDPKPAEQMRYLLAVAFVFGLAIIVALVRLPPGLMTGRSGRYGLRVASLGGQVALIGVATWSWSAQFSWNSGEPSTVHFSNGDLVAGTSVACLLALLCRHKPNWIEPRPDIAGSPERWGLIAVAVLLTGCWLLPSVFREQNLAVASREVTYHLQFTFDEFVEVVNGRTPLVNFAGQYSSLLPFLVWPALHLGGAQIGTFTSTMCLLSLVGLIAIERGLALVSRNERLALALYVPFLATSLFFILRGGPGGQEFSWASYYAVFPMRYVGPFVLFWLCIRHLSGLQPRSAIVVFALAGLVVLNNVEFGAPAFAGACAAVLVGGERGWRAMRRMLRDCIVGVSCAAVIGVSLTLLVSGQPPDLGLLTFYSRLFAEGGYGLLHTPVAGLYLIVDMTFAASVLLAAVRYRRDSDDGVYSAALGFTGVFGLGAGNYYMGRTHPAGLVVLFAIWALTVVLLALLALRSLAWRRQGSSRPSLLLLAGAIVSLGVASSSITQFPAPWTQIQRIEAGAPPPAPFNISAAVAFVRSSTTRGEAVVLFAPLGHLIAQDAGVENVLPYSHPDGVVTYEQLNATLKALSGSGGTRFFVDHSVYPGVGPVFPEIAAMLMRRGFSPHTDVASGMTEWRQLRAVRDSRQPVARSG